MTTAPIKGASANFGFLACYDEALVGVTALAERYFADDPVTCLMKLRQFGELLAQQVAARAGVFVGIDEAQSDLLGRLRWDTAYPRDASTSFRGVGELVLRFAIFRFLDAPRRCDGTVTGSLGSAL